ncbi:LOW QUALITY PROTEIN: fibrinogen-like protein 1 [Rhinatrema bivittatum]|uniref:LOW QUALITY PROTEIN: fibrinogen-like protein 1 n=1 Tax=Rhinatrema bivittatum TaxID=194408 RepID=UPI001126A8AF|nr:LOW QUALITY PROTEIN: fibrinogen-like protein 1 [Rhinatrema bivittatum]
MNSAFPLKCFSGIAILLCLSFHQVKPQVPDSQPVAKGEDCSDIWKKNPESGSGVYSIKPAGAPQVYQVFCEMNKDGGWTVIQKHDGADSLAFDKGWEEYKQGFGNRGGEHWLGLDPIYYLTNQAGKTAQLLVSLEAFSNAKAYAQYASFKVGNEENGYHLSLGAYSGTAGDAFRGQNDGEDLRSQDGSKFSTIDRDNDGCDPCRMGDRAYKSCSQDRKYSGWWFSSCGMADLNGEWHSQDDYKDWDSGVHWETWNSSESLKSSVLKIKTA